MDIKHTFIFICFILTIRSTSGQVNSNDVEVWGLTTRLAKAGFINQLNEKKLHVCMADIRPLGYKDANVIGMDNIYLVTLRPIPLYPFDKEKYKSIYETSITKLKTTNEFDNSHAIESQLAIKNFFAEQHNDTGFINKNLKNAPSFDTSKYKQTLSKISSKNSLAKEDCIAALYYSNADSIKENALVFYISKIKSNSDIFKLLPFLLDNGVDLFVGNILRNYFKYNHITENEWDECATDFSKILNSPSPTITYFITDILTQQKIPLKFSKEILKNGSITIKEILNGRHSDIDFYKQKIYPFLTYISGKDFGANPTKWLNYIDGMRK